MIMRGFRYVLPSALIMLGCSRVDEIPSFSQIPDSDFTPEAISDWQTYAFIFSDGICTGVEKYPKLSDCRNIDASAGDIVSVIAMESMENIGFTNISEGEPAEDYHLLTSDMSPVIPRTWATTFTVAENQKDFRQVMTPLTSELSISVKNAPESFMNATLPLVGFANGWRICSSEYISGEPSRDGEIKTEGEVVCASFLPGTNQEGTWKPGLLITLDEEKVRSEAELDWKMTTRSRIDITIDFTDFELKGIINISYTHRNIMNPRNSRTVNETLKTSYAPDNRHYMVQTRGTDGWTDEKVHDALCSNADKHSQIWNDWSNSKHLRDTMSYCIIDTGFPATIRVKKISGMFSKAEVRPSTYGIAVRDCGDNTIEFTLPSEAKGKVSVEFDSDRQHNLFIYAREPDTEKPAAETPGVIYYGKGEHNAGTIRLKAGQTLYIDHGAKVYANVKTEGSNVTIAGHGILSGEKMVHTGDSMYSWGDFLICCNETRINATNLTIKDITMIDSPGWNLIIPKTDGVLIDGVNMISWELNGDGIDVVSSRNVQIRNCFLRTYDDCITLKCRFIVSPITDVSDINIHDCLIWADYARGIVIGPEAGNLKNTGYIHDITVKDCIFLQHKRGLDDDLRAAFAIGQGSDGSTALWTGDNPPRGISDVTATGLTFDNIDKSGRHIAIWQYGRSPVTMENISLNDINVIDSKGNRYPALYIKTNGSRIDNMKISGFTVNSQKVTSTSENIKIDSRSNVALTVD